MLGEYFLKVSDFNEELLTKDIDIVAIGSMGCCKALPDIKEVFRIFDICIKCNKKLRLYTPRIPQEQLGFMMDYIQKSSNLLISDNFQLVVNDIGLLLWMREKDFKTKHLILGATYSWSAAQNSLFENIIRDENDAIKKIYVQVNNNNDIRLSFFKNLNITEIEVPNIKKVLEQVDRIRNNGFSISIFDSFILAGYSRSCVHAKIKNIQAKECNKECEEVLEINMDQMWDYVTVPFPYFIHNTEVNSYFSLLYVHGNMQYRAIQNSLKGDENQMNLMVDTIIKCAELDKVGNYYE